jgi:GNAT superfamily N-acetyltransferase
MEILPATPQDVAALRQIAIAAKGHWGYSAELMARFAASMDASPLLSPDGVICKAWVDETLVGWYGLTPTLPVAILDDLWVLPAYMGRGVGRTLFTHAVAEARYAGAQALELDADPNAAPFYARLGCEIIGETMSEWDRTIPRMRLTIEGS